MQENDLAWERLNPVVALDDDWARAFVGNAVGHVDVLKSELLGGLVNSNYVLHTNHGPFFLRIVSGSDEGAEKERALLPKLASRLPCAQVIATATWNERPVVLQEWLDGTPLKAATRHLSSAHTVALGREVGKTIARLHDISFETTGFLDGNAVVARPFNLESDGYLEYVHAAIGHAQHAMDRATSERAWDYACQHAAILDSLPRQAWLTHGDLHANNILVSLETDVPQVTGIVDWESALAWIPIHDLAHLVRRPFPGRSHFERGLVEGFLSAGGVMPAKWEPLKGLLQLLGWVDKLATGERRPNVIDAANQGLSAILGAA